MSPALGGACTAQSAVPRSLHLGVAALAVGAVPPGGSICVRLCSACEHTGVHDSPVPSSACPSFSQTRPFWPVEKESDAGTFLTIFVGIGGSTDGFVNISAKGYNVLFVQFQGVYFAGVFQDKSNKAYLSSVTHTTSRPILVIYGLMMLYHCKTNI